ncbi:TPA: hypothetical protein SOK46_002689 [Clostridioides difficile]|uniref:hypothetical protein n=1 Tax=Clostridioides sp. ES-S-0108-01 TaxID=2770773 RepID=UPI001C1A3192|nr:hypothetical protein [Clostridioides sp. ES-S-0108-01]HBG5345126.1 hypothetical protein [Clostridioides difficile]HEK4597332.1 hypothetical protein [Clostridioides difficile]HEK5037750.1 hypothetical protein [Clostridioides difficile]HEK8690969.1 hypothetical protein [Clostridioides difficile]
MGMYTEFVCAIELKKDTPKEVINILNNMIEGEDRYDITPPHPFFECRRWRWLFIMDSYSFSGRSNTMFEYDDIAKTHYLTIRSNLKNYDDEINKFLNWIKPYIQIHCEDDEFLGYSRYEECRNPELIYYNEIQ